MSNSKYYLLVFLLIISACTTDEEITDAPKEQHKNEVLVDAEIVKKISSSEIDLLFKNAIELAGISEELVPPLQFKGITVYKLTYKTSYPGMSEKIIASGALVIPDDSKNNSIISYQHGTITDPKHAPSFSSETASNGFAALMASLGFYVSVPDYLGYGETANLHHPYEHGESLATASYDMILASRKFIASNEYGVGDKLFLTGYSEGGYATMALHQYIEEKGDLTVTASAPAAGAYNKSELASEIISKDEPLPFIRNYLWVLDTYNWVHKINKPWSYFINEPYASNIDPNNPLSVFDAELDSNPSKLFTESFRNEISSEETSSFKMALKENDRFDWKANAKVRLYYGTKDDFVYPLNSTSAHKAMKEKGSVVELFPFEGKNHFTAVNDYSIGVLIWFLSQK
jgi:dienelactone hydrolase